MYVLPGQEAARRAGRETVFELDAAVTDADLGIGLLWKGLEVTAIDGTTMELGRNGALEGEFDTRSGRRPAGAAGHRARPHRDLPLDRHRGRRLPRPPADTADTADLLKR